MRIYSENPGACIEPGGLELMNETRTISCDTCGKDAVYHQWESCELGCINSHWRWQCDNCGAERESLFA